MSVSILLQGCLVSADGHDGVQWLVEDGECVCVQQQSHTHPHPQAPHASALHYQHQQHLERELAAAREDKEAAVQAALKAAAVDRKAAVEAAVKGAVADREGAVKAASAEQEALKAQLEDTQGSVTCVASSNMNQPTLHPGPARSPDFGVHMIICEPCESLDSGAYTFAWNWPTLRAGSA
eukprot:scaffold187277_cov19-Tisochrysis_lutea.AAC.2